MLCYEVAKAVEIAIEWEWEDNCPACVTNVSKIVEKTNREADCGWRFWA